MKRESTITQFDRFLNKIIASASMFVLLMSTMAFLGLFFYRDITTMLRNIKQSTEMPQPVFDLPSITLPKTEEIPSSEEYHKPQSKNISTSQKSQKTDDQREADKIFIAYELGDTALASKLITDFIVDFSTSPLQNTVRLIGAKIMNDKEDYNGAMNYIQKILSSEQISNKDYSESVLLLGEIARKRKQHDSYIQSFLEQAYFKAVEPIKSKLAFYLGYLFLNKGDFQSSLSYFNNVIGEDGVLGRADLYAAQVMHPETINALQNFLEQYPTSKNYDYARSTFLKQVFSYSKALVVRGYMDNAQRFLEKIIHLFPTSKDADLARIEIATIYYDKREFDRAQRFLSGVIENNDTTYNPEALFMLGQISFEKNAQEQALGYFRLLTEDFPNSKLASKAKQWQELLSESLRN
ncbi:MAG: tetratricopeptide repeat protein [Brevinema sp.]